MKDRVSIIKTRTGIRPCHLYSSDTEFYFFYNGLFEEIRDEISADFRRSARIINQALNPIFPLGVRVMDIKAEGLGGLKSEDIEGVVYSVDIFQGKGTQYLNSREAAHIIRDKRGADPACLMCYQGDDWSYSLSFIKEKFQKLLSEMPHINLPPDFWVNG